VSVFIIAKVELQARYLGILNHYFTTCFHLNVLHVASDIIEKIDYISGSSKSIALVARSFEIKYHILMSYNSSLKKFHETAVLSSKIEKGLGKFEKNLSPYFKFFCYMKLATAFLIIKKHDECLTYVLKVISFPRGEVPRIILATSHMIEILAHYDLEDHIELSGIIMNFKIRFKQFKDRTIYKLVQSIDKSLKDNNEDPLRDIYEDLTSPEDQEIKEWIRIRLS